MRRLNGEAVMDVREKETALAEGPFNTNKGS
jgi:hypothetical protein